MSRKCPTCGDEFASEQGMKVHHKRVHGESLVPSTECEQCGGEFPIVDYSKPNRFCSAECLQEHNRPDNECAACGRRISGGKKYCHQSCHLEDKLERPRPGDVNGLLWVLYVYEGFSILETFRRQRAVLGADNCLTTDEVRERLDDIGEKRQYSTHHWTLQKANPGDVGTAKPEGDDGYKQYYGSA
jgi:hypothetical protein